MSDKEEQLALFETKEWWADDWEGMPEYVQTRMTAARTITINFLNKADIEGFGKLINQKIHNGYNTYWHPKLNIKTRSNKKCVDDES